jgi:hypothetical protein
MLTAKRATKRDELRRALEARTLSAPELLEAARVACHRSKVAGWHAEDVAASVVADVIRRNGGLPTQWQAGPELLRIMAAQHSQRDAAKHERAMGTRATAELLERWNGADERHAATEASKLGGDAVYAIAENRASEYLAIRQRCEDSPRAIIGRLAKSGVRLSPLQTDAIVLATCADREAERASVRWPANSIYTGTHSAVAILRRAFPSATAVRLACRDETYAAQLLVDAAISKMRERASVATHGSHLCGMAWSPTTIR